MRDSFRKTRGLEIKERRSKNEVGGKWRKRTKRKEKNRRKRRKKEREERRRREGN